MAQKQYDNSWCSNLSTIDHGKTHHLRKYDNMAQLLSDEQNPTPLIQLTRITPYKHTKVYAKIEWLNPFGSIKDRVAANLIKEAKSKEKIGKQAQVNNLVEPTSGNTGLGLSMMTNILSENDCPLKQTVTMSKKVPQEKRNVIKLFGADLVELEDDL